MFSLFFSFQSTSSTRSQDLKQIRQVIHANATRALSQDNNRQLYDNNRDVVHNASSNNKQNITKIQNNITTKTATQNKSLPVPQKFDKNQGIRNLKNQAGSISKSSSNKSIPIENSKLKAKGSVKPADTAKPASNRQRSQSEVIVKTTKSYELKALSARVAHAKPRYLEPRKRDLEQQAPIKKNQNMKNKLLSSSDISRTPSPKGRVVKKGESSNMSLDSLASSQRLKTMSTDSLTPTMDEGDNRLSCAKQKPKFGDKKTNKNITPYKATNKIPVKTNFKVSRTLTSPTKSSAAKMVPTKKKAVNEKKKSDPNKEKEAPQKIIPQMERSGTFVKELATE